MVQSNEFMLLFRLEPSTESTPTASEMESMKAKWGAYIGTIAIAEKLVSTHQLGWEGRRITSDLKEEEGIYIVNNITLGGNMVVKAKDMTEAISLAKKCPILQMGGSVEVRNILPM